MDESYTVTDNTLPPSYDDLAKEDNIENKKLGPATLHVAGRFVHSADPGAPPLYEFSHSIGFLGDNDRNVTLERLDQTVVQQDGVPKVQTRKRHLFDLKHPTKAEFPTFPYHAETTSRRALCPLGIRPFRPRSGLLASLGSAKGKGYRVHRGERGPDRRMEERDILFTAVPSRDRAVGFEWRDAEGGLLAREVETDDLMSLVVTAEMESTARDALVAAWILRVWCELSKGNYRTNKWDDAIRILHTPTRT